MAHKKKYDDDDDENEREKDTRNKDVGKDTGFGLTISRLPWPDDDDKD